MDIYTTHSALVGWSARAHPALHRALDSTFHVCLMILLYESASSLAQGTGLNFPCLMILYESAPSLAQGTGQYFPCMYDDTGAIVTFHDIQVSAGMFCYWHRPSTYGTQWDVAWSVVKGTSRVMFAGSPEAFLAGASLITQFAHSSPVVRM